METFAELLFLPGDFYYKAFFFLFGFLICCLAGALPLLSLSSLPRLLLLPLGFANFCSLLAIYASCIKLGFHPPLLPFLGILLLLESLPLLKSYPPLSRPKLNSFLIPATIYFFSYLWLSAGHYDLENKSFFVPGFEINHDAISLLTNVRLIQTPALADNQNPAIAISTQSLATYPSGGSYLTYFFASFLNRNPYQFYPQLIIAGFLLVIFPLTALLKQLTPAAKLPTPLQILILLVSVINYLSVSFIDSAVFGSVIILPIILTGLSLILGQKLPFRTLLTTLISLSIAGIFLYSYILPLYLAIAALISVFLTKNRTVFFSIVIATTIALLIPINFTSLKSTLVSHLTSQNPEANLFKGMRGNTAGFTNPLMPVSLWFSSDSYLQGTTRIGNLWIVTVLLSLFIPLLYLKKRVLNLSWQSILILLTPFALLTTASFLTRSPYQHAKVMHHLAILWPLSLTLLLLPFLNSSSLITRRYTQTILLVILLANFGSAVFARAKIHPPLLDRQLNLEQLTPRLCAASEKTLFIGPDEWSRYFLAGCPNLDFFLDRALHPENLIETARLNTLHTFRTHPKPGTLKLPPVPPNFDTIILDESFDPTQLTDYEVFLKSNSYYLLKKAN